MLTCVVHPILDFCPDSYRDRILDFKNLTALKWFPSFSLRHSCHLCISKDISLISLNIRNDHRSFFPSAPTARCVPDLSVSPFDRSLSYCLPKSQKLRNSKSLD